MRLLDLFKPKKNIVPYTQNTYERIEQEIKQHQQDMKNKYDRSEYKVIVFSDYIESEFYVGSRLDHMRKDYTIDPAYYISSQHVHGIWSNSHKLVNEKTTNARQFFGAMETLEKLLNNTDGCIFVCFDANKEYQVYTESKSRVTNDFIERSFKNEYKKALELKTEKGRNDRIEHWFSMIDFYIPMFTGESLAYYNNMKEQWKNHFLK